MKEVFPYSYYTKNRYLNGTGSISEACKCLSGGHTKDDFIESLNKSKSIISEDTIDMI